MKRATTITITTLAAFGLIFMMGFAGTVAAQDNITIDTSGGDAGDGGDASVQQELDQENNNAQVGVSGAASDGFSKYDTSETESEVEQEQTVDQGNTGEQVAEAIGGDGGDGGDGGNITLTEITDPVFNETTV